MFALCVLSKSRAVVNLTAASTWSWSSLKSYAKMASMNKFIEFENKKKIPILGLGTWKSAPGEVFQAVKVAIDAGYRHIDCAHVYNNEKEVGAALAESIASGAVKREDLFITSKLWNTDHHPEDVPKACQKTLDNLQLSYLDLYLIHWPMSYQRGDNMFPKDKDGQFIPADPLVDYVDTYLSLEKLVGDGKCRSIGLSNFSAKMIKRVLERATIHPANLQIELHPLLVQERIVSFCKDHNITVTAYSPLGSPDRPWVKEDDPHLMTDPIVTALATKKGKSPAQVLIRFALERGIICIPKSVTPDRIRANFEALNFELSADEMNQLLGMDRGYRGCALDWVSHVQHPFTGEDKDDA